MNMRNLALALSVITFMTLGCYRETGIEILPVTSSQSTDDNRDTLNYGTDSIARRGDYLLQNALIQVAINGDMISNARDIFNPKSNGAIIDMATQFEKGGNRTITPRNDDGINLLQQGVNLNRNNPIGYNDLRVVSGENNEGSLVLTGSVYDLDGSLAAQGGSVDGEGRLVGATVVTTLKLRDFDEGATQSDQVEGDLDRAVRYLEMTTVVSNTSEQTLPIFDVADMVFTTATAADTFVAYPDWGWNKPDGGVAYPHYAMMVPLQRSTAHYGFFSREDQVIKVAHQYHSDINNNVLFVGKANMPAGGLAPGEAVTFMRQASALNGGSTTDQEIRNDLLTSTAFQIIHDLLLDTASGENPLAVLGRASLNINFPGSNDAVTDGRMSIEYMNSSIKYYDGTGYTTLEEGRSYPMFGDNRIREPSQVSSSYSLFLPPGQVQVRAKTFDADEEIFVTKLELARDEDGEVIFDEDGNAVFNDVDLIIPEYDEENIYSLGSVSVGISHTEINFSVDDKEGNDTMARITFERTDEGPFVLSERPTRSQGNIFYIDDLSSAASSGATFAHMPVDAQFNMLVSRGPLNNVNIVPLDTAEEPPEDQEDQIQYNNQFSFQVGRVFTLDDYFSADFDIRGGGDPNGTVFELRLLNFAHAEDLDVFFYNNVSGRAPVFEDLYTNQGRLLGGFNSQDEDDNVDTFFDEVGYSRAMASIGKVKHDIPDRGRFALLNLPDEENALFLEPPLMVNGPATWFSRIKSEMPDSLIHVTRPRAPFGTETGMFTAIAALSNLPAGAAVPADNTYLQQEAANGSGTKAVDFDLIQLLPGKRYDEYLLARADWFNMLNAGIFRAATGGTSSMNIKDIPMGAVRTYVRVDNNELRDNDLSEFWQNAKAGRSFVTNGPLIEASIGGASFGQTTSSGSTAVTANLTVRGAYWVPIQEVRVIVNGEVVQTITDLNNDLVRFDGQIEVPLNGDGPHWVVFEAGATLEELALGTGVSGTLGRVLPGHLPLAFTNPIFVD